LTIVASSRSMNEAKISTPMASPRFSVICRLLSEIVLFVRNPEVG
jgi:hypothetical protein